MNAAEQIVEALLEDQERVVAAAVLFNGQVITAPTHAQAYEKAAEAGVFAPIKIYNLSDFENLDVNFSSRAALYRMPSEDGFATDTGRFVDREEAYALMKRERDPEGRVYQDSGYLHSSSLDVAEALLEADTIESALAAIGAQVAGHEVKEGYVELQVFVPADFVATGSTRSIQSAIQPFALHKVYVLPQEPGYFKVVFTPKVTEALLEDLRSKMPHLAAQFPQFSEQDIEKIAEFDPTNSKGYTAWLLKQVRGGRLNLEAAGKEVSGALSLFDRYKSRKEWTGPRDINQVQGPDQLYAALSSFTGDSSPKTGQTGAHLTLRKITSEQELMAISGKTAWCTKKPEDARKYLSQGALYLVFKDARPYVLVHPGTSQARDIHDVTISDQIADEITPILGRIPRQEWDKNPLFLGNERARVGHPIARLYRNLNLLPQHESLVEAILGDDDLKSFARETPRWYTARGSRTDAFIHSYLRVTRETDNAIYGDLYFLWVDGPKRGDFERMGETYIKKDYPEDWVPATGREAQRVARLSKRRNESAPEWVQQRMSARVAAGWNPRWPFVPVDLYNPSFREAIQSDPELSQAEKQQILSFAPGGKNERSLFGESVIVESLLGDEADVAVQEFANTVENYAEEVFTELTGISGPNEGDESEPAVAVHGGVCSTKSAEAIQTFLAGLIGDFKLTDRVIHLDVYLDPEAGQCPKKLGKFYSFSVFFKRLPPPERPHEISFAESIAVDLDGTLARDNGWKGPEHIGKPIKPMLDLVQKLLDDGEEVVIFTARCHDGKSSTKDYVKQWLKDNGLPDLEVTNEKRPDMEKFYDDKAVEVETNKGVSESVPWQTSSVIDSISAQHNGWVRIKGSCGHMIRNVRSSDPQIPVVEAPELCRICQRSSVGRAPVL